MYFNKGKKINHSEPMHFAKQSDVNLRLLSGSSECTMKFLSQCEDQPLTETADQKQLTPPDTKTL